MDILSSSVSDDKIAWYKNIDGLGNFSSQQIISETADGVKYIIPTDFDNDGDIDILAASSNFFNKEIVWYKNLDGFGTFSTKIVINSNIADAKIVAGDLDNDGDIDILSTNEETNNIVWYENMDSLGSFSSQQIISEASDISSIALGDVNNDNKIDVLFSNDIIIAWYENLDNLGNYGEKNGISYWLSHITDLKTVDIDNDGDLDLIAITRFEIDNDKIVLFKNTDGLGAFTKPIVINSDIVGGKTISVADIDNDGDMDILSASIQDNIIAWYENLDGLGNFGNQLFISNADLGASTVLSYDVDGDGDMDVLASYLSYQYNQLVWFENINGNGTNWFRHIILSGTCGAKSFNFTDLDNDGDIDVIASAACSRSTSDHSIFWFENDGIGNFMQRQYIYNYSFSSLYVQTIESGDIDGDGDKDILAASTNDEIVAWYENLDGFGSFDSDSREIIAITDDIFSDGPRAKSADLDNDGDIDIVVSKDEDEISSLIWFENMDGFGNFSEEILISNEISLGIISLQTSDIDNDGDLDVIYATLFGNEIAWFENLSSTISVNQNFLSKFSVYPNPVKDKLEIVIDSKIIKIEIYNQLGQQMLFNENKNSIDISTLNKGLYFVKIKDEKQNYGSVKVIKK